MCSFRPVYVFIQVCVYVHSGMHMCSFRHAYVFIQACVCVHSGLCICSFRHAYVFIQACICVHSGMHMCSFKCVHVFIQAFLQSGAGDKCNIVCTEPRRVSAISLATRVSEELGDTGPGERDAFCGYQIRFESKRCETTRLMYCTTGVLLRKLQQDPLLKDVTHVIVDEVSARYCCILVSGKR